MSEQTAHADVAAVPTPRPSLPGTVVIVAIALALRASCAIAMWFAAIRPIPGVTLPDWAMPLVFDPANFAAVYYKTRATG